MKNIFKKNKRGFVILFAVTIASIMLAIGLGVADIALKEVKFQTSAKDTNDAFFAADEAIECALMSDKPPTSIFQNGGSNLADCFDEDIPVIGTYPVWTLVMPHLTNSNNCAIVTVTKDSVTNPQFISTSIVSKGYNIGDSNCASTNSSRVERELDVNY